MEAEPLKFLDMADGLTFSGYRRFSHEGDPDVDFFNCTAFGKQAGFVEKYLWKGIKIVAVGRIENGNYINKEDHMVYSVKVLIEEVEFAEGKNAAGNQRNTNGMAGDGFMNIPGGLDEELPFN